MVLGLKINLRDVLVRVVLTVARWIIEALADDDYQEPHDGTGNE